MWLGEELERKEWKVMEGNKGRRGEIRKGIK